MTESLLITGANRGIGLEFVRAFAGAGHRILACCRQPEKAEELAAVPGDIDLFKLDVADGQSVANLAQKLAGQPIDVLIHNAGIFGERGGIREVSYDIWRQVFEVNTMGPMRVTEALLPNLEKGRRKTIVAITSRMGSIQDNTSGGAYVYRSSKTALNMVVKSLATDLAAQNFVCVALHPGWVQTDMGGPNALITTKQSVTAMKKVVDQLETRHNGTFLNFDGSTIAW